MTTPPLLSLTTLDTVEITGRGTLHVVLSPVEFDWDENPILKSEVMLDGRKVKVIAMERKGNSKTRKGDAIGIIVREVA